MSEKGAASPDDIAAYWFARMRADHLSARDRREFERWRDSDPAHAERYAAHEAVWDVIGPAASDGAILAMRKEALSLPAAGGRLDWRRYAAMAASVLIVALTAFLLVPGWAGRSGSTIQLAGASDAAATVFRTAVGQRSTVPLPDGSTVELNTDSLVQVAYDGSERRIILHRGQALFDVAKDKGRPFTVEAGGKLITAHGTAFDVRRAGDRVQVTLLEGKVTVEREGGLLAPLLGTDSEALEPGDQLIAAGKEPFRVRDTDVERVVSWRQGQIIFTDEPLGEVVSEINRYSTRKVVLGDASMAKLRISGVFRAGSVSGFTSAIEATFPIRDEVDEQGNAVILKWQ